MNFILSPEIIKDIIFAMENQDHPSLFDTERGICVPVPEDFYEAADYSAAQRFYPIPDWNPAQGFRLMELFTAKVRNPILRETLQKAFIERKGVFRRFKEILKTKPDVELQWFRFKETYMQGRVYSWYNDLRQCWGLERLSFEEDELSSIIQQDFSFAVTSDSDNISMLIQQFEKAYTRAASVEKSYNAYITVLAAQLREQLLASYSHLNTAMCITASACGQDSACGLCVLLCASGNETAVVPVLKVLPEYRGMGIGKELLKQAVQYTGKKPLIFAELCIPDYFHAFLERNGFIRTGLLYTAVQYTNR